MDNIMHSNEKTELGIHVLEQIVKNLDEAETYIQSSTSSLSNILINRVIAENFKIANKDGVNALFNDAFSKINDEISNLFKYYRKNELEFYSNHLNTADMIFNSRNEIRIQRIYLDNLMKKIDQKQDEKSDLVFTESVKGRLENKENQSNIDYHAPGIDKIFEDLINKLIGGSENLDSVGSNRLKNLMQRYYELYRGEVVQAIRKLLDTNKSDSIAEIEDVIGKRGIRDGKTRAVAIVERMIINDSRKIMDEKLDTLIQKHREKALEKLKENSASCVDVIFRVLPESIQSQRGLLEIILDTNINEKLANLLDEELVRLTQYLKDKNQDTIVNELYEEKRYKNLGEFEFNLNLVDRVYRDVLHEIKISYDIQPDAEDMMVLSEIRKSYNIPEPEVDYNSSKRLNLTLNLEANSTRNVFTNLCENIKNDNERSLRETILDMRRRSKEAKENNGLIKSENISTKRWL